MISKQTFHGTLSPAKRGKNSPVMYIDQEGLQVAIPLPPPALIPPILCALITNCVEGVIQGTKDLIEWCEQKINEMAKPDAGTCSCQHRDVHTSSGQSCQRLRELGICGGPYKGTGYDTATCQANARDNTPLACRGCLGHCLFRPAQ